MFLVLMATLAVLGLGTFAAELWTGIVVTGWQGEKPYILRAEQPVHYWVVMTIHFLAGFVLPILVGLYQL